MPTILNFDRSIPSFIDRATSIDRTSERFAHHVNAICLLLSMSDTIFSRSQSSDPEMDIASERARSTFKFLWRELSWELRRIIPGVDFSAVKKGFPTDSKWA